MPGDDEPLTSGAVMAIGSLPAFRAGDFSQGLREGTARLMEAARRFKSASLWLPETITPRIETLRSRPRHAGLTVAWA